MGTESQWKVTAKSTKLARVKCCNTWDTSKTEGELWRVLQVLVSELPLSISAMMQVRRNANVIDNSRDRSHRQDV